MPRVYLYVVDRDFGFAPNPFHGCCTLATCKAGIRKRAQLGDWVFGMGGSRLSATGKCIFAMQVTEAMTFDEYWNNPRFLDKRPVRNGSSTMVVGDNIYHRERLTGEWQQADSHHSNPDGAANQHNLKNDTKANRVLISTHFYYYGAKAPTVPPSILASLPYTNGRNYRVYDSARCRELIGWLSDSDHGQLNTVSGDPFDFDSSERRYSVHDNKIR
jgi:hypothetical protein